jgi:hypothetical protein
MKAKRSKLLDEVLKDESLSRQILKNLTKMYQSTTFVFKDKKYNLKKLT